MKLLIDDTTARTHNLNANEACVFAAVLKCTRAGRGWFASMQAFADALPFAIDRKTVSRAVQKLLTLGLVTRRDNALFVNGQNDQSSGQNDRTNDQFDQLSGQNDREIPSPNNPFIINNGKMNEKEHATCAQACDTRDNPTPSFNDLMDAFKSKGGKVNNYEAGDAFDAWLLASFAKRKKLLEAVKSGAHFKARLDWLVADFPEPQPDFLRGDETDADIVQVRYNGLFKLCTRETMNLFGLEFVRDWKK